MTMIQERPQLAKGYGISTNQEGMLTWDWVDSRMAESRNYWVSSTRPDGKPHAVPVWGVWLDGALYFGGDREARRSRNFETNPHIAIHLESGDEAVIMEGSVEEVEHDMTLLTKIAEAMAAKYPPFKPDPEPMPGSAMYRFKPQTAFAWLEKDYPNTATRWKFE